MKCECEVRLPGVCLCKFEAGKRRYINICAGCIKKLRKQGLGPEQLLEREEVRQSLSGYRMLVLKIIREEYRER